MARLTFFGAETGALASEVDGTGLTSNGTAPTFDTGVFRSGAFSFRVPSGANQFIWSHAFVSGRDYFIRAYVRIPAAPSNARNILWVRAGGSDRVLVRLNTDRTLNLMFGSTVIGSASAALTVDTWYRIELKWRNVSAPNDSAELRLDGTSVASATNQAVGNSNAADAIRFGQDGSTGMNIYFDDIAVNDDQGASQNTWTGEENIVFLKPISDNGSVAAWRKGDNTTATNLWDAVNNTPPVGVAVGSPGVNAQIRNTNTIPAPDDYDANLTSYTTAGIGAGAQIAVVQALVSHGEEAATGSKSGMVRLTSNPDDGADTAITYGDDVGAVGTWPTNWRTKRGPMNYAPSVTKGNSPVMRIRMTTNNVITGGDAALMGAYVAYAASVAVTLALAAASPAATTSLALTAPTQVPLSASSAAATTSLALTAPTQVPLNSSVPAATTSMSLVVPTRIPLAASSATATTSLNLVTPPVDVVFSPTSAAASTSLSLTAPTQVPLGASSPSLGGTLALSATTYLTLTSNPALSATLDLAHGFTPRHPTTDITPVSAPTSDLTAVSQPTTDIRYVSEPSAVIGA